MRKLMLLIVMLLPLVVASQSQVKLGVWQDARLAVSEGTTDNYQPFTLNLLTKLKLTGKQLDNGYLVISPMFEYAELEGIYKRYAFDIGYAFNQSLLWGLDVTPSINYGIQDRWGKSFLVFGADLEVSVELTNNIRLSLLGQAVERKDLLWAYDDYKIGFSGFVGIVMQPFN